MRSRTGRPSSNRLSVIELPLVAGERNIECNGRASRRVLRITIRGHEIASRCRDREGGIAVLKRLALLAICLACPTDIAMAQDAKTVIAAAQKALGDVKSITYSGSAKDVAFQQCGANKADMRCRGTHDPKRPINNYVRVIDQIGRASCRERV